MGWQQRGHKAHSAHACIPSARLQSVDTLRSPLALSVAPFRWPASTGPRKVLIVWPAHRMAMRPTTSSGVAPAHSSEIGVASSRKCTSERRRCKRVRSGKAHAPCICFSSSRPVVSVLNHAKWQNDVCAWLAAHKRLGLPAPHSEKAQGGASPGNPHPVR